MKTVYVLTDHDFVGGAEVNYKDVITAYQKRNIQIIFIAPGTKNIKSFFKKNKINQVFYRSLPSKYHSLRSSKGKISLLNILRNYIAHRKNRKYLLELVSKEKPLAIISNAMLSHILISNISKDIVCIAHIQDIVDREQLFGIYGRILDYIVNSVDKVITISDAVVNTFLEKYLHKVHKIYNPVLVPDNLTQPKNGVFLVGMFARYVDWKGHEELVKIVKQVRATKNQNIKFVCFGNAYGNESYFEHLQNEIKKYNLTDYIDLNSFTNDVMSEMNKCSIILHLSVQPEPFGRILIEANMLKKPILAYQGGGVVELFNNLNLVGEVVDVYDHQAISKAIVDYQKRNLRELVFPDLDDLHPDKYVQKFINVLFDE